MKFKRNLLILSAILIGILIVVVGCTTPIIEEEEGDVPSNGTILIAGTAVTTNDTTPTLTLSSTGATHMAFSGNGTTWSAWVAYATTYSAFNITTGEGCTSGDGTKIVYVKFKNDVGESTKVYDSIYLDTVAPKLSGAVYSDANISSTVNKGDTITFTFNDEMLTSTVTSTTVSIDMPLSAGSYGTGPTVSWNTAGTVCTVILGTSPTIVSGTTVNPSASVKDTAGNADASTAVTISGTTTTVLSSVSISPSTYSAIAGSSTTKIFTASALSTAATTMTSSCTFTWSISGAGGTISTTSGTTTIYTPAASAGTDTLTLSAVKTGTTTPIATKTVAIAVSVATPPTPLVDPNKLFVSVAGGSVAKYTSVPTDGRVEVYRDVNEDGSTPMTKIATLIDNEWTNAPGINELDYIFFEVIDSNGDSSGIMTDGQVPTAPNPGALLEIEVTGATKANAFPAGNVFTNDQVTLYITTSACSNATTITGDDTTINLLVPLIAGDQPRYSKTDPTSGHESGLTTTGTDGTILELTSAVAGNVNVDDVLDVNDTITLGFTGGENVTLTADITVSHISWVTTGAALLDDGTGTLADIGATGVTVDLTATATCHIFTADETVTFNISDTIPIVDTAGGNQVLPRATGFEFTSISF